MSAPRDDIDASNHPADWQASPLATLLPEETGLAIIAHVRALKRAAERTSDESAQEDPAPRPSRHEPNPITQRAIADAKAGKTGSTSFDDL